MIMEIVRSAPLLTIQDLGRDGWRHLGVPRCGAMDPLALQQANLLLGNEPTAAGLEITSAPLLLRFSHDVQLVLMGADLNATHLAADGKTAVNSSVTPGFVYRLAAGEHLHLRRSAAPGLRALLAVAGGFDVEPILGSRSTDLMNGFGGWQGRSLKAGDQIPIGKPSKMVSDKRGIRQQPWSPVFRVIPAADHSRFDQRSRSALLETLWTMQTDSNRMGLRLRGEKLTLATPSTRQLSVGVLPGVIQVPPDGQPVILAVDAQTTGGYPTIASIICADLWQLAYMTPGTTIQFEEVSLAEAHGLSSHQRLQLQRLSDSINNEITR